MWRQGQGKKLREAARLLARGELTRGADDDAPPTRDDPDNEAEAALAAFGLVAVDDPATANQPRVFHLWPEHQEVLGLFVASRTQWRTGFAGAIGMDYAGIEALNRMRRLVPRQRLPEVMAELQVLEAETLAEWSRQRRAAEQRSAR